MIRFEFNKLIRHKIRARMIDEGVVVNSVNLGEEQYILKLKEKLLEEAKEVSETEELESLTIELADVLEVIHAIAGACKIDFNEIEQARLAKASVNGEFSSDNYINYIEVEEDNFKVINYLNNKYRPYKLEA